MNSPSNSEKSRQTEIREEDVLKRYDRGGSSPTSSQPNEPPPEQTDQQGGIAVVGDSEPEQGDSGTQGDNDS